MRTVIVLNHDQMGQGDLELGQKILATFLRKSISIKNVAAVLLYNSAVRLIVSGSPVLGELAQLHENGVDLLACGTCLDHYGLRESVAVGTVAGMEDVVRELDRAEKVITL